MSSLSHLLKRTFSLNGKKSSNYSFNDVCVCDKLTCKLKRNDNNDDREDTAGGDYAEDTFVQYNIL